MGDSSRALRDIMGQPASLRRTLAHYDEAGRAPLAAAAECLRNASRIIITGIGASLHAALPMEYSLCAQGLDARVIEAGELLHHRRGAYRSAAFVLVSRSGESVELVKWMRSADPSSCLIAVTNSPDSYLGREARLTLDIKSLADGMIAIQTYSATIATLHLLAGAVGGRLEQASREVAAVIDPLRAMIESGAATLGDWDRFFGSAGAIYCLARGPSVASALEGALLFGEAARVPAVGMLAASFRHGPVEVVDEGFRALMLAPLSPTRSLTLALAADLMGFGGKVRLIGPPALDTGQMPLIATPPCPEALTPLVEIVPLQLAAYRLGEIRGVSVGRLRYAPQVTRSEEHFAS